MTSLVFGQDTVCWKCRGKGTFKLRGADLPCGICGGSGLLAVSATMPDKPAASTAIAHARRTDPDTSHEAAHALTSDVVRRSQQIVLAALHNMGPSTDRDLYEQSASVRHYCSLSGARTRRKELVVLGKVRDTGLRRMIGKRRHIVWEAVE